MSINALTPELNPSTQHCLMRFIYWVFCFLNHAFLYICVKNQQIHQLFIQLNCVW
jgi:hypothetical protein